MAVTPVPMALGVEDLDFPVILILISSYISKPSLLISFNVSPKFESKCAPETNSLYSNFGCSEIDLITGYSKPYSARLPVKIAIFFFLIAQTLLSTQKAFLSQIQH